MTDALVGVLRVVTNERGHWAELAVNGQPWLYKGPYPEREAAERELEGFRAEAERCGLDPALIQREQ